MHRLALAGLLPALVAAPGGAQRQTVITEAEFLSVLDPSHPAVAVGVEDLAVARARRVEAATLDDPVLGAAREDPSGPSEETDWTLSLQLPHASRGPTVEARERAIDAAAAGFEQRRSHVRSMMREVYARWALAWARQGRLSAQAERVAALAAREAERAERGEASGLERHRLDLAATLLRSRVALAAAAGERARAEAALWFPDLPADARPLLPPLPPAPEGGADPPRVRAAEAELAAASLEREAADRFVRSPELSLGWQRQETGEEALDGPLLGVAWSLPLFDRGRAERAVAEARAAGARARLELTRREVDAARTAARAVYERLSRAVTAGSRSLAASERTLDGAEAAFRHGEASLTDLLETHRSVAEAELAVLDLHEEALAAHRELERLAGPPAGAVESRPTVSQETPR